MRNAPPRGSNMKKSFRRNRKRGRPACARDALVAGLSARPCTRAAGRLAGMPTSPKLKVASPKEEPTSGTSTTDAAKCVVSGEGLKVATSGSEATFTMEARDAEGARVTKGGDSFFVFVRGPANVRAKVTDNLDGTYTVQWRVRNTSVKRAAWSSADAVARPARRRTKAAIFTSPCRSSA